MSEYRKKINWKKLLTKSKIYAIITNVARKTADSKVT